MRNLQLRDASQTGSFAVRERALESVDKFAPDLRSGRRLHRFAQGTGLQRPSAGNERIYHHPRVGLTAVRSPGAPLVYSPLLADHRRQEARGFSTLQILRAPRRFDSDRGPFFAPDDPGHRWEPREVSHRFAFARSADRRMILVYCNFCAVTRFCERIVSDVSSRLAITRALFSLGKNQRVSFENYIFAEIY